MYNKYQIITSFIYLLFSIAKVFCQEYSYVRYDTKEGLAGSTVYDITQDKDGFIWFGTNNGLSRFDGTHFKNFTVKDGLPDNEVLKVFTDSKNRVWIGTFSKEVCYYYRGKIHNKENDSIVKKLKLTGSLSQISESKNGSIVLISPHGPVFLIRNNNAVVALDFQKMVREPDRNHSSMVNGNIYFDFPQHVGDRVIADKYYVNDRDSIIKLLFAEKINTPNNNPFVPVKTDTAGNVLSQLPAKKGGKFLECIGNTSILFTTTDGCWLIDTIHNRWMEQMLKGRNINRAFIDNEENIWFSTLGEGVYKLPSREIRTYSAKDNDGQSNREVFSIIKSGNKIYAGINFSKCLVVTPGGFCQVNDFTKYASPSFLVYTDKRLYTSKLLTSGALVFGFDGFLVKVNKQRVICSYIYPVKSLEEIDKDNIIAGTSSFVFKMRAADLSITDTIWRERSTKVFYHNGYSYIGTLAGLYKVSDDKTSTYLGILHPTLSRRITDIKEGADGVLWVSSSDSGIIALKEGRILCALSESNGLSSNICRTLFLKGRYLWAGTNKGINKIDISQPRYPVVHYNISDGLPSDVINAIYVEDSIVWAGTPAGLTCFNENRISKYSICNLSLLSVNRGNVNYTPDSAYTFSYNNKSIDFEFAAVSVKSGGFMTYHYRLKGLYDDWQTTTGTNLNYQSLKPGEYNLEIYAVNKFGVTSKTLSIRVTILTPFWMSGWFYLLMCLLFLSAIILFFQYVNSRARKKLEERGKIQQQFAGLEQQALQAQMNPHFIFNCLSSIQQYILINEKEKASEYLGGFAMLIRKTLDYSGRKAITVAEEADYLEQYIELERMRFGYNFSFSILIDPLVQADFTVVPALLLQPYVENSLRHGIRNKREGKGEVHIHFNKQGSELLCTICDNGVGREKAAEYISSKHIVYQSKGMSLTQKRIDLLNKMNKTSITVQVQDLKEENGKAAGTRVIIKIPAYQP